MGIMTIVYALIVFCLLIFVHELGHFTAAKAVGIRVNEFSLGMGPAVFQFTKGDTAYSIRALPIGGYVKMEGEDEDSEDVNAFNNKSFPAKALVIIAGSAMNLLTCILLLSIVTGSLGIRTTEIAVASKGAEAAGIQAGDTILAIEGQEMESWTQILNSITASTGETVEILVERAGEQLMFYPEVSLADDGRRVIGIETKVDKSPGTALKYGVTSTFDMGGEMVGYLKELFQGKGSMDDLVGPVGIVTIIGEQARIGLLYVINFTAFISLNLAIVNMLPLPALDGGRLLFMIIRLFTGKAISDETEGKIHFAGMMLLFGLMIYIVFQDVGRFIIN